MLFVSYLLPFFSGLVKILNALSVAKSPLSVPELFTLFYDNYNFNHILGDLEKSLNF